MTNLPKKRKPILCLDFDGVMHSYTSGWRGANVIPDQPVEGLFNFLKDASEYFNIQVFSSRSLQPGGTDSMREWLLLHASRHYLGQIPPWIEDVKFPRFKPAAFLSIDDRAITFTGNWPDPEMLLEFKPWNKP